MSVSDECIPPLSTVAQALWNNMLEPVGHKSWDWRIMEGGLRCPMPENPYFTTYKNPNGSLR